MDIEKGQPQPHEQAYSTSEALGGSLVRDPQIQEALTQFRHYVGIHNDPDLAGERLVANLGIYQRIVKLETNYKKQFSIFSWLINSALGLQIIFAASLTALGAGNGPRSAVTAFGALNTIIAAFLTYLKGSGLPNRLKYYKEELTKVREYIEQREREFARGDTGVDLKAEVIVIESMYDSVKRDIEMNTPEAYVSRTRETIGGQSMGQWNKHNSHARREMDDHLYDIGDGIASTRPGLQSRVSQARLDAESRYMDTRSGVDGRLSNVRYGLESRLSEGRLGAEKRLSEARHGVESQYNATRSGVEGQINTARLATAAEVEETRHGLETRIEEAKSGVVSEVEETRHGVEARMKEVQGQVRAQEDKFMNMAERVAERVLAVTHGRHEHDQKE